MTDPIERIISIIFRAQGEMTMDDLCSPGSEHRVYCKVMEQVGQEVDQWFRAKYELMRLND